MIRPSFIDSERFHAHLTEGMRRLRPLVFVPLFALALSCTGSPRVDDDRLIQNLDSAHWQIRASAADELGRRRATRATARLTEALTDESDEVRGAAVMSLGLLGAKSQLDSIRELIDEEEHRQVKVLALYALGNLAGGETGDALRDDVERVTSMLDDDSRRVKRAAARVLKRLLGDNAAAPQAEEDIGPASSSGSKTGQLNWVFDRIDDRVELAEDGECTLTRTLVLRGVRTKLAGVFRIDLPSSFPQVDRVVNANGDPLAFGFARRGATRRLWFRLSPHEVGEPATVTFTARSRRPLFLASSDEALLVYSPAPAEAEVAVLRVELSLPAGGARAIEPSDLRLRREANRDVATVDRTNVAFGELDDVVLRVGMPVSALKLPRPPPRSYGRGGDLALIASVVVAALAVLAAVIFWLRRKLGASSHRAILVAALTTGAFLFLTPQLIQDNLPYYALASSAVLDGDLDRTDEYAENNQTQAFDPDNRGPLDPLFGSFFRTPFLAAAHQLTHGINAFSPAHAPNGFSFPYMFAVAVGDFLAVLIGCLACFSLVERRIGRPYALFAVLAIVAGTNLHLFAYGWTGSSFQPSFLLFAVFLDLWDRTRGHRSGVAWLCAGVLLGLLGATRTINFGFVLLPFLDWTYTAMSRYGSQGTKGLARHAGHGALFTAGMLVAYAPQLVLQRLVDHTWLLDVYGVSTGRFSDLSAHLMGLFFMRDPNRLDGLLPTMPILALAFAGLVPLFRFDRRWGALLTATLALQIFAIGSYEIYWGYFWYGTPYLVPSLPIFCLALGSLMKAVHVRWPKRGLAVMAGLAILLAARTGWCTLRQFGFNLTGEPNPNGEITQLVRALWLPDRKFDVDVLLNTSAFGCLLKETVGALRSRDFGQLMDALFWVALLLAATLAAYAVTTRLGRLASRVPSRSVERFAVPALGLIWLACAGWMASLGAKTDVDYRALLEQQSAGIRELKVTRIEPRHMATFPLSFEDAATIRVVTFLEDAEGVPQGSRVATIEVDGSGQPAQFELTAGVNTADIAVDRPESKAGRAHTAPLDRSCLSWRVGDDSSHLYTARAYCAELGLPAVGSDFKVKVTSTLTRGTLAVVLVSVVERKLPRDPSRRRWLADRW